MPFFDGKKIGRSQRNIIAGAGVFIVLAVICYFLVVNLLAATSDGASEALSTILGGVLTLIAGVLAYTAGMQQVTFTREQNARERHVALRMLLALAREKHRELKLNVVFLGSDDATISDISIRKFSATDFLGQISLCPPDIAEAFLDFHIAYDQWISILETQFSARLLHPDAEKLLEQVTRLVEQMQAELDRQTRRGKKRTV